MQLLDDKARVSFCRNLKDAHIIYGQVWSKFVPIPNIKNKCECGKCKSCQSIIKFNKILCNSNFLKLIWQDFEYVLNCDRFLNNEHNILIMKQNIKILIKILYEIQHQITKKKLENEVDEFLEILET